MACAAWFEHLSAAVDGELGDDDLGCVEDHCATCAGCRRSRRRMEDLRRRSLVRIPHQAPALAAAILAHGSGRPPRRPTGSRAFAAAGIAILLIGGLAAVRAVTTDDPAAPAAPLADAAVTIRAVDDQFDATTLTVAPGTTIEWENDGQHTHRLVRQLGGELVSSDLAPGGVETVTFNESGDYEFYCSIHDGMNGRILVET